MDINLLNEKLEYNNIPIDFFYIFVDNNNNISDIKSEKIFIDVNFIINKEIILDRLIKYKNNNKFKIQYLLKFNLIENINKLIHCLDDSKINNNIISINKLDNNIDLLNNNKDNKDNKDNINNENNENNEIINMNTIFFIFKEIETTKYINIIRNKKNKTKKK